MKFTRSKQAGVVCIEELDTIMKDLEIPRIVGLSRSQFENGQMLYPVYVLVMFLEKDGPIPDSRLKSLILEFVDSLDQEGDPMITVDALQWYVNNATINIEGADHE